MKSPRISLFTVFTVLTALILCIASIRYPLLGSVGPESGMIFALVLSPLLFLGGSVRGAYRDPLGFGADLIREGAGLFVAIAIFASTLFINSYFSESCAPQRGLVGFLVHVIPTTLFNLSLGILVGRLIGQRWLAFFSAVVLLFTYIAAHAYAWWADPSFKIFAHPLVAIDRDLLTGADLSTTVIGFRAATLCFSFAFIFLGVSVFGHNRDRFLKQNNFSPWSLAPVATFLLLGLSIHHAVIGFFVSYSEQRQNSLHSIEQRGPFRIHYDNKKTSQKQALATLAEAALWGDRLNTRLGMKSPKEIDIWLYADSSSLFDLTGATNVHFAFPHRREIHITSTDLPHPTLGHEIAHVLIGESTTTYLSVPGQHAIFINQGLTEGLAVFLTEELAIRDELTVEQQSAALLQLGQLPNLDDIFTSHPLGFFEHNTRVAYAAAGYYVKRLVSDFSTSDNSRQQIIEQLASSGSIDFLFESPQAKSAFEMKLRDQLKEKQLPPDALASMMAVLKNSSILLNTCNMSTIETEIAPKNDLAAAAIFLARAKSIDEDNSREKQRLLHEAGDLYWRGGDFESAADAWRAISHTLLTPDESRLVLAKQLVIDTVDSQKTQSILDFLVFSLGQNPHQAFASAMKLALNFEKAGTLGLSEYLLLRTRVLAQPQASDVELLLSLSETSSLPVQFQMEYLALAARTAAMTEKAEMAPQIYRNLAAVSPRDADAIKFEDYAERAERIASALKLNNTDPIRNDQWILGVMRLDQ